MGRRIERLAWIVAGLAALLLVYRLPFEAAVLRLEAQSETLGVWGPLVYAIAYALFSLLFVPASALGIGAGAVFGFPVGGLVVLVGGNLAASVGFARGRSLGRRRVEGLMARRPAWRALDQQVERRGTRIVALVRLLPIIPFSASNYVFGFTGIPYRGYALTSAWACLPGMAVYVGVGHFGRLSLEGLLDERLGWGLGVLVLLAVVVLRSALRWMLRTMDATSPGLLQRSTLPPRPQRALLVAAILGLAALLAESHAEALASLLGPPPVRAEERYGLDGARFDHGAYDRLLAAHVDAAGAVDYPGLWAEGPALAAYLDQVAAADFEALSRDEKLAFLINAYNASTLQLILDHWPLDSILDIPADQRWRGRRFGVGRRSVSLDQLEHRWIRSDFIEPRVHFALVCASRGCPPLLARAYRGDDLEATLAAVTARVHADPRYFDLSADGRRLGLTPLYDWYRGDLTAGSGALLPAVARFAPPLAAVLAAGGRPQIHWLPWDWALNRQGP